MYMAIFRQMYVHVQMYKKMYKKCTKKKTMDFLSIELGREKTSVCSGGSDRALILLRSVSDSVTGY